MSTPQYYEKNKAHVNRLARARRLTRLDHARRQGRRYYRIHAQKRSIQSARWRELNKEKRAIIMKVWRAKNQQHVRDYVNRRYQTNVQANLRAKISGRMLKVLGRAKTYKSNHTMALLGTSLAGLRAHIESLFAPGMSWGNRAKWHIDHVRPCASFDLRDPAQQRACFHFSNLQPLWKIDNLRKADKC